MNHTKSEHFRDSAPSYICAGRVTSRKRGELLDALSRSLGLDRPRLSSSEAVAMWKWRGQPPPAGVPAPMQPLADGVKASIRVDGVLPEVACYVQMDFRPDQLQLL